VTRNFIMRKYWILSNTFLEVLTLTIIICDPLGHFKYKAILGFLCWSQFVCGYFSYAIKVWCAQICLINLYYLPNDSFLTLILFLPAKITIFFIRMCIQCLGHFSPLPPQPKITILKRIEEIVPLILSSLLKYVFV
jgi:hypothetical protein